MGGNDARSSISREEIGKHRKEGDLWIAIEGKVYDVSKFAPRHPGRLLPLMHTAGKDATVLFNAFHKEKVKKWLPPMQIGVTEDNKTSKKVSMHDEMKKLRQEVIDAGLFIPDPNYFLKIVLRITGLFCAATYLIFSKKIYFQMLGGCVLGLYFQQFMLFAHELCHNSVLGRDIDNSAALSGLSVLAGISAAWWKASHNTHHIVTNSLEDDPDIQHLPFFAVDRGYFENIWSTWHNRILPFDALSQFMVRRQYYLFYPVMCVARSYLYIQSYIFLLTADKVEGRIADLMGISSFFFWFGWYASQLPTWSSLLLWICIVHAVAGVLHVQITISHFPMDIYTKMKMDNDSESFLHTQLATTMDLECSTWMDWFHGGLQFQIEHHLFPMMPGSNLRKCREMLRVFCKKHGIEHKSVSFYEANRMVLKRLAAIAKDCPSSLKFKDSTLYDVLSANG